MSAAEEPRHPPGSQPEHPPEAERAPDSEHPRPEHGPVPEIAEPVIRLLDGLDEYAACVRLQEATWGEAFSERVPVSMLKVAQRLSGVVGGAFSRDGSLEGFVFGITGMEAGVPVHWSDMLAVRPGARNGGLGRRLKLFQRQVCLERGIRRMYWTFDPLESRNAWLNLGRLGAVAREYVPDMYGVSDSPLHRGIGTDRLVALWDMDSERVEARLAGTRGPPELRDVDDLTRAFEVRVEDGIPVPDLMAGGDPADSLPEAAPPQDARAGLLLPIPADVQAVKTAAPDVAAAWRRATREVLVDWIGRGWEVRELVRGRSHVSYYLLGPPGSASDGEN